MAHFRPAQTMDRRDWRVVVVCAAAVIGAGGCSKKEPTSGKADRPNVVLVTFDTTRVDFLSCYGHPGGTTPTLDRLASEGIRYAHCYTTAPITLPAHATMLTGLYPFQHALRDNGMGPLDDRAVTLAEVLRSAGYRTGAVIGAYVLHSRYGLNQGFDYYGDSFADEGEHASQGSNFAERRAESVTDDALTWLDTVGDAPFFLWAHYFDPHGPYEAPGAPRDVDVPTSYAMEITYADRHLDRLLQRIERQSQTNGRKTLIVFTADHGESLGEHGEATHAYFAYNATLQVPLIFKPAGDGPRGVEVQTPVTVADIFPTVLDELKLKAPNEVAGRRLPFSDGDAVRGANSRPLYFETYFAYYMYGWSPLEGVVVGREKYISAPQRELYDLAADPKELRNLAEHNKPRQAELASAYKGLKEARSSVPRFAPPPMERDAASLRKLQALGYVGASSAPPDDPSRLADPKVMLPVRVQIFDGEYELNEGDPAKGVQILASVLERDPDNRRVLQVLCEQAARGKAGDEAVAILLQRMNRGVPAPFDAVIPESLGDAAVRRSDLASAVRHYTTSLAVEARNGAVHAKLGGVLRRLGRTDEAIGHFLRAVEISPELTGIRAELGALLLSLGRAREAAIQYEALVKVRPDDAPARYDLAAALIQSDRSEEAIRQLREVVRLDANHGDAWINLGVMLMRSGDSGGGREAFHKAARIESAAGAAWYNLGVAAAREGKIAATVEMYEKSVASRPPYAAAVEELSAYYLRERRGGDAVRVLRMGAEALPDNVKIINTLAAVLATSSESSIRNGEEALRWAHKSAAMTEFRQPVVMGTLAAAQAESGDFAAAVATVRQALELIPADAPTEQRSTLEAQLQLYESGRPYRNPRF